MPRRRDDEDDDDSGEHPKPRSRRSKDEGDDDSGEHERPARRRRAKDESGEYERPARKSGGLPVWVWVLVAVCGFVFVGGTVFLAGATFLMGAKPDKQVKKKYTREEFKTLLIGKSKEEVLTLLGRPDSTEEPESGNYWTYYNVTSDPVSNKTDPFVLVYFNRNGIVERVRF